VLREEHQTSQRMESIRRFVEICGLAVRFTLPRQSRDNASMTTHGLLTIGLSRLGGHSIDAETADCMMEMATAILQNSVLTNQVPKQMKNDIRNLLKASDGWK
jgi:hypothetical protein